MLEPSDSPEAVTAVMNLNRRSKWSLSLPLSTPLSDSALRKLKIDFRPRTNCWQCPRLTRLKRGLSGATSASVQERFSVAPSWSIPAPTSHASAQGSVPILATRVTDLYKLSTNPPSTGVSTTQNSVVLVPGLSSMCPPTGYCFVA